MEKDIKTDAAAYRFTVMKGNLRIRTNSKSLILAAAVFFAAAMAAFPEVTGSGSRSAISIWINAIVPVLLPFFIFADFIKRIGNLQRFPETIYPFLIAFLSGYPMGAKAVGDLVCSKKITKERGCAILSYSLVTGPAFLMGTVGAFLGGRAALVILLSHYLGAVLNGLFFRIGEKKKKGEALFSAFCGSDMEKSRHESMYESFNQAILSGFRAMAVVLAYLIFFMIGMDLIELSGFWRCLNSELSASVLKGFLEMTAGANMISLCNATLALKTVLTACVVSFGGLSVIGQSVSMSSGSGIRLLDILKIKTMHGILSGISAMILVQIML